MTITKTIGDRTYKVLDMKPSSNCQAGFITGQECGEPGRFDTPIRVGGRGTWGYLCEGHVEGLAPEGIECGFYLGGEE